MNFVDAWLERAQRSSDVVLAVAMAAVVGAMLVPLPAWLLDAGLALNLAAAVALLVAALQARDALQVTAFPTLLLVTTLFRLSLNVSSTRLALSEGHAGQVIEAFGEFVVRGDYVVGTVIFCILTLVQFLVVTKGAERVAEVSARFTLDAMPGKQMSIDADLRAGAIDQAQARQRRRALERESQMFGAMDGAMKFVKGDLVAGLVITAVNFVGGTAVGVLQGGMGAADAAGTYALIAIGDGLVSQIPSLVIAVAAGLVVTRVAGEREDASLGAQMGAQFFGRAKALWVVSGLSGALALIPGMPHVTFLALAAALGGLAHVLGRREGSARSGPAAAPAPGQSAPVPDAPAGAPVGVTPLTLDLAPDLLRLTTDEEGSFVRRDLERVREQLYAELGVRIPGFRVRTGAAYLPAGGYALLVDEVPVGRGQLVPGALYALVAPEELAYLDVKAEAAVDPASGRAIARVPVEVRERLQLAGVAVQRGEEVLCQHLLGLLRRRAGSLLGVQEVQELLEAQEARTPALVKEALGKVPLALLTDVLRKLLQEEVSIRNLRAILEALVCPTTEGDAVALAERCRQALHRYLSHKYAPTGPLYAYLVDPAVEELLREQGRGRVPGPEQVSQLLEGVRRIALAGRAVVLAAPDVRRPLRKLCEGSYPDVAVLTYGELDAELQIRPVGRLAAA
jgi:type III secretion protein V